MSNLNSTQKLLAFLSLTSFIVFAFTTFFLIKDSVVKDVGVLGLSTTKTYSNLSLIPYPINSFNYNVSSDFETIKYNDTEINASKLIYSIENNNIYIAKGVALINAPENTKIYFDDQIFNIIEDGEYLIDANKKAFYVINGKAQANTIIEGDQKLVWVINHYELVQSSETDYLNNPILKNFGYNLYRNGNMEFSNIIKSDYLNL